MKRLHLITFSLVIIGGLNWLLVGLFDWNLATLVGGEGTTAANIVYILIGLSAVYEIATHKGRCKACGEMMPAKAA